MAATAIEAPETRLYRDDGEFRRFTEVMLLEPPKLEVDQFVTDAGEVKTAVVWLEDKKPALFDAEGNPTKQMKECLAKYNKTREAWRKGVPEGVAGVLSLLGLGPKVIRTAPSSPTSEDPTSTVPKKPSSLSIFAKIATLLCFVVLIWYIWPIWKVLIDPETTDNYKLLGLPSNPPASKAAIKKAFRLYAMHHHPDKGGDAAQYMRVYKAKEELLELKDSGMEEEGLSGEAKENNLSVVMFIGFVLGRFYTVSLLGSEFVMKLVDTRDANVAKYTQAVVHTFVMALFIWESGLTFSSLMLVYNLYNHLAKLVKNEGFSSPWPDHNHLKWECWRYVVFIFVPCTVLFVYEMRDVFSLMVAARGIVGCVFVACFIHRHRPYIFVQHALRSRAYAYGHPFFSRERVLGLLIPVPLRVILELFADDVLAYAMHVPTQFRAACFVLLFVSVLQNMVYPPLSMLPFGNHEKWKSVAESIFTIKQKKDDIDGKAATKEAKKSEAAAKAMRTAEAAATTTAQDVLEQKQREENAAKGMRQSYMAVCSDTFFSTKLRTPAGEKTSIPDNKLMETRAADAVRERM